MGKINELQVKLQDLEEFVEILKDRNDYLTNQINHLSKENARISAFCRELIMEMDSVAAVASQELDNLKHPRED